HLGVVRPGRGSAGLESPAPRAGLPGLRAGPAAEPRGPGAPGARAETRAPVRRPGPGARAVQRRPAPPDEAAGEGREGLAGPTGGRRAEGPAGPMRRRTDPVRGGRDRLRRGAQARSAPDRLLRPAGAAAPDRP